MRELRGHGQSSLRSLHHHPVPKPMGDGNEKEQAASPGRSHGRQVSRLDSSATRNACRVCGAGCLFAAFSSPDFNVVPTSHVGVLAGV
jgi:hypothetical protein